MLPLLFFFFATTLALDCEANGRIRATYCHIVPISSGCSNYYQFGWNTTSYKPLSIPYTCKTPTSGSYCSIANTCLPSCFLGGKGPGLSGYTCSELYAECISSYADNYGDKWCYKENITPDSWGICTDGPTCHN